MKILGLPLGNPFLNLNNISISVTLKKQEDTQKFIQELTTLNIPNNELPFPDTGSYVLIPLKLAENFSDEMSEALGIVLVQYARKIELRIKDN